MKQCQGNRVFVGFVSMIIFSLVNSTPAISDSYSAVVLADNPVGYWRLNDSLGSGTATDSSVSNLNGTANNVMFGASGAPLSTPNTAALFNGSSSYIVIPDNPALHVQALTLEAWILPPVGWIKPPGTLESQKDLTIYGQQRITNGGGITFGVSPVGAFDSGLLHAYLGLNDDFFWLGHPGKNTGVSSIMTMTTIQTGLWSHIVATYDGFQYARIYINGIQAAVNDVGPVSLADLSVSSQYGIYNGNNPFIGRAFDGTDSWIGTRSFNGIIGEVAIYNYALTDAQILNHANGVPEPSTMLLLGIGLIGLAGVRYQ